MKRINQFLFGAFALLSLMACSNNDSIAGKPTPPQGEENNSYIQVNLAPLITTRGDDGEVFVDDNKIDKIDFYLLNSEGEMLEQLAKVTVAEGGIKESEGYILKSVQKPGTYSLLAVANAKDNWILAENENALSKINQVGTQVVFPDEQTGKNFLMTNKLREKKVSEFIKDYTLNLNYNLLSDPLKLTIKLDRSFAAVNITASSEADTPYINSLFDKEAIKIEDGLNFKLVDFMTLNVYEKFYAVQNWEQNDASWLLKKATMDKPKIHQLGEVAKSTNYEGYFNSNPKVITEHNSSEKSANNQYLAKQGYATGIIFRVKAYDANNKEVKFYATKDADGVKNILVAYNEGDSNYDKDKDVLFEDGMYYTYFIQDPNRKVGDMNLWTTVRNTFYNINLTSIKQLGGQNPGGELKEPENPDIIIDPNVSSFIEVTVDVEKWIDGGHDIDK